MANNSTRNTLILLIFSSLSLSVAFINFVSKRGFPSVHGVSSTSSAAMLSGDFDIESWAHLFHTTDIEEVDYWVDDVEGVIPFDIDGSFCTIGPGHFERGNHSVKCWLDGDGLILSVSLKDGRAYVKSRFIQTDCYVQDKTSDKFESRGQFGTMKSGSQSGPPFLRNAFDMKFKNPSNTRAIFWGGKLFSCYETALPYELSPETLDTIGEWTFNGQLKSGQPVTSNDPRMVQALSNMTGDAFTAHACIDEKKGVLVGWSWKTVIGNLLPFSPRPNGMEVTFYEWDEDFKLLYEPAPKIFLEQCAAPPHDWILTDDYYIWFQHDFSFDLLPCLLGLKGPGECLVASEDTQANTMIHLVPRPGGIRRHEPPRSIAAGAFFMNHFSHAYQEESADSPRKIVAYGTGWSPSHSNTRVFGALYGYAPDYLHLPMVHLFRLEIDLDSSQASFQLVEEVKETFVDFPKVYPKCQMTKASHVWMVVSDKVGASSPPQGYASINLDSGEVQRWRAGDSGPEQEESWPHVFVSEAAVIRKEPVDERSGYLMGFEFNAKTGRRSLCIYDCTSIAQGPLAKIHMKHRFPWGIHSDFYPHLHLQTNQTKASSFP